MILCDQYTAFSNQLFFIIYKLAAERQMLFYEL